MTLYLQETENPVCWPQSIETAYQLIGGGDATALADPRRGPRPWLLGRN